MSYRLISYVSVLFFLFLPLRSYADLTDLKSEEPTKVQENCYDAESFGFKNLYKEEKLDQDISDLLSPNLRTDFDIPFVFNEAVDYYVKYFATEKRKVFSNWLRRSRLYVPLMREILKENGLPEDIVYLAMIESGFNPKAYSPKKASGPWQFISETGKRYGLRVSYFVDERRDPEKSTIAAAKYLKELFDQFGCWFLAAAGYNAGEKRIERAIEKHETQNFWELVKYNTLPSETKAFIPKILAAAIIAKNPERFGFEDIIYDEPLIFKKIKVPGGIPLKTIANAAQIDIKELKNINPELLRGITPPDENEYLIRLPQYVDETIFEQNMQDALKTSKVYSHLKPYRVKKNDSMALLLQKHKISYEDLVIVNSLDGLFKIKKNSLIYIPTFFKSASVASKRKGDAILASYTTQRKILYYRVQKGDTLLSIAKKYNVDAEELMRLNGIKDKDKLPVGKKLKIVR